MSEREPTTVELNTSSDPKLDTDREALEFQCALLHREVVRLVATNRSLEIELARAEAERDELRDYLNLIRHSLPWRTAQTIRGWFGRAW